LDIIWVGLAFALGVALSRLHIPPLVSYLAAGLALAAWGYEPGAMLPEIAHLGKVFLLFTVGLHIRLGNILRPEVLGVGLIHLAVSTAIFTPICLYFGLDLQAAVIVAIVLGFSSTVLTAKSLESRNEMGAYYGRVAIGILILQDLVAIGLIAYSGDVVPSPWAVLLLGLPLLRPALTYLLRTVVIDELLLLMALAVAIGGEALFEAFNVSGELGAIVMGMLLAGDERAKHLEKKIWSIKEAFLVGFFLQIGLIGFPSLEAYAFIGVFLLLLPLKSVLFYALFMAFRLRARTGFLSTMTLTVYSEFTLIAGSVAAAAGLIPVEMMVVLGMLTAISYILNSFLVRHQDAIWQRLYDVLLRYERAVKHPDHKPTSMGAAGYLVIGMNLAGQAAYDRLKAQGKQVVGMDVDPDLIQRHLEEGRRVVYGDVHDAEMWRKLRLPRLESILVAISENPDAKQHIFQVIRESDFRGETYALAANEEEAEVIRKEGARPIAMPETVWGERLAEISIAGEAGRQSRAVEHAS
jgi:predicted Kef-type K+ transport protein